MEITLLDLNRRVARLEAIESINDALRLYGQAIDWLDRKLLEPVFFDDADIDYGAFHLNGREAKDALFNMGRGLPRKWHFTAPPSIVFEGDAAARTSSFQMVCNSETAEPGDKLGLYFGWFLDRFELREGRWAIARRKHVLLAFTTIAEHALPTWLSALTRIHNATPEHPDFMNLMASLEVAYRPQVPTT
jgi:hypothetical protein